MIFRPREDTATWIVLFFHLIDMAIPVKHQNLTSSESFPAKVSISRFLLFRCTPKVLTIPSSHTHKTFPPVYTMQFLRIETAQPTPTFGRTWSSVPQTPSDASFNIDPSDIRLIQPVGEGSSGIVFKARYNGVCPQLSSAYPWSYLLISNFAW